MKISTINRFFNILLGALAMVAVAIFSAYLAMRIAIHGREVEVPTLSGLTLPEAAKKANHLGLRLNIENRFYSPSAPAGTVLSQSPAPKSVVRRDWTVRVTQSLGPQQVSIPNLLGQSERPATIAIRRLGLELGTIARIPDPGPSDIVLAQTPNPSDTPAASPRISLLLSAPQPDPTPNSKTRSTIAPATSSDAAANSFVMPTLTGLTLSAAYARANAAGLHIISAEYLPTPIAISSPTPPATILTTTSTPTAATPSISAPQSAATTPTPIQPTTPATVVAQSQPAGHRVQSGDSVKLTFSHEPTKP
jgi:beta-lactam-binding protein with PASTA domain